MKVTNFLILVISILSIFMVNGADGNQINQDQIMIDEEQLPQDDAINQNNERAREALEFVENEVLNINQDYYGETNEASGKSNKSFAE